LETFNFGLKTKSLLGATPKLIPRKVSDNLKLPFILKNDLKDEGDGGEFLTDRTP